MHILFRLKGTIYNNLQHRAAIRNSTPDCFFVERYFKVFQQRNDLLICNSAKPDDLMAYYGKIVFADHLFSFFHNLFVFLLFFTFGLFTHLN